MLALLLFVGCQAEDKPKEADKPVELWGDAYLNMSPKELESLLPQVKFNPQTAPGKLDHLNNIYGIPTFEIFDAKFDVRFFFNGREELKVVRLITFDISRDTAEKVILSLNKKYGRVDKVIRRESLVEYIWSEKKKDISVHTTSGEDDPSWFIIEYGSSISETADYL